MWRNFRRFELTPPLWGTFTLYSLPVSRRTNVLYFPFSEATPIYLVPLNRFYVPLGSDSNVFRGRTRTMSIAFEFSAPSRTERKWSWANADVEVCVWRSGPGLVQLPAASNFAMHCVTSSSGKNFLQPRRTGYDGALFGGCSFLLPAGLDLGLRVGFALEILSLYFADAYLGDLCNDVFTAIESTPQHDPMMEHVAGLLNVERQRSSIPDANFLAAFSRMVALHAIRLTQPNCAQKQATLDWERLRRYVIEKIRYELSVEDLAAQLGLSHYQLLKQMKRSNGQTPQQFITECRVQQAKLLLANRRLGLAEIALEVGFSSQSHLTTTFKKVVGVTPNVFRGES